MKRELKIDGMSQELAGTVAYIGKLKHDELAPWVDEPIRSTMAMIKAFRAERDKASPVGS